MKRELRVRLRYPTPPAMLAAIAPRELQEAARAADLSTAMTGDSRRSRGRGCRCASALDAYERLRAPRQADRHLLLLWPTLAALWIAARRRAARVAGADLHRSARC